MKVRSVALCAAAGAVFSAATVYSLVPVGVAHGALEITRLTAETLSAAARPEEGPVEVTARVGHDVIAGEGRTFVMLELRGKDGAPGAVAPGSTALVIDTSGSMLGERMQQATAAARAFIARAPEGDLITVLGFSTQAYPIAGPVALGPTSVPQLHAALASVTAAGDTCLSCGVREGMRLVGDSSRVQRVIVLSDGKANVGIDDVPGFRALASTCRERGISVSTIGLGTDYNEKVLSVLASDANGLHHFVASPSDLRAVFEREEARMRSTVAANVTTELDLAPGVELVGVVGRPFDQVGQRVRVDVGPMSAGDLRTVLVEVRAGATGDLGGTGEVPLASMSVTFQDPAARTERKLTRFVATRRGAQKSALDGLVAMRLERATTASALERASELFEHGHKTEALALLDAHIASLSPRVDEVAQQAHERRDPRAGDIGQDLHEQVETAKRARKDFQGAQPSASSGSTALKARRLDFHAASL